MDNFYVDGDYSSFLRLARLSDTTKASYSHYIDEFRSWAEGQRLDIAGVSACHVLDWIDSHENWASSTRYGASVAVRKYFAWHFGEACDVAQNAKVRREKTGPQRSLDWEQLDQVLGYFDDTKPKGIRDRAMVALMVDTGLREAEVCRAELRYWDKRKRQINVIIKGADWGIAEYFGRTAGYLAEWMQVRTEVAKPETKTIFCSIGGNKPGTCLTPGGLRAVFRVIGKKSEIGAFSPHDCRRTMAVLSALAGAPTVVIQKAGRWESLEMVELYTKNLKPSGLKPFSPMDNLDKKQPTQ